MIRCADCDEDCKVKRFDTNFSHEFGIEQSYYYGSSCCGSELINDATDEPLTATQAEQLWLHDNELNGG